MPSRRARGAGSCPGAAAEATAPGREAGVALVELAFVLPVLVVLVLAMLSLGKAFNYWNDTTHLANEGARWAVVDRNPGGGSLQQYIQQQAVTRELRDGGTDSVPSPARVCISFPNGSSEVGDPVEVKVSVDYSLLPFVGNRIGIPAVPIEGSSVMRLEQLPTQYGPGCFP